MTSEVEITVALAVTGEHVYMAGAPVALPPRSAFTRLFHYDARSPQPWTKHDVPWYTVALARHVEPASARQTLCVLSEEGEVELDAGAGRVVERIPGAGLNGPTATKHGYVSSIRSIGGRLFVCGDGGQVYRRLGPERWERMDDGLLEARGEPTRLLLSAIDGPAEDDIYVAGEAIGREARAFHWNGSRWRPIQLPAVGAIHAIHVESERRVWLAGLGGALLIGNHRSGFTALSSHRSPQVFYDLTHYEGTLYLASSYGLFKYDNERKRVVRTRTDLSPDLDSLHTVDHADGVLWCVGPKDIASFDGKMWRRVHHPDNPKIGA